MLLTLTINAREHVKTGAGVHAYKIIASAFILTRRRFTFIDVWKHRIERKI